jgi:CheY-like chemotaxis protein
MAKIEAGKITPTIHVFDLHLVITGVFNLFSLQAEEQGISYRLHLPSDCARFISSDERKIRQILINLISNAIKFTPSGTVLIQVNTRHLTHDEIPERKGEFETNTSLLTIDVIDSGIGIEPKEICRIFDPFEQVINGKRTSGGTGLGLAISQKFAEILGGTLTAVSSGVKGEGSVFRLEIPFSPQTGRETFITDDGVFESLIAESQEEYRILIVDDRKENRELLASFHHQFNLSTRQVASGEEAIQCFRIWHPHLIWMDILMPNQRGDEALRIIREEAGVTQPIVIAITAGAFEVQKDRFLEMGFDDFLSKPYTRHDILDLLRKTLNIEFRHHKGGMMDLSSDIRDTEGPVSITNIDPEIKAGLIRSAEEGNITHMHRQIQALREHYPEEAALIQQHADLYDFTKILTLLREEGEK